MILLGFGIVQIGLSLKSHDPLIPRANGFLTLAGGVIITFAKEILTLITGYISDNKKTQDRAYGADPLCGLLRKAILRTEVV